MARKGNITASTSIDDGSGDSSADAPIDGIRRSARSTRGRNSRLDYENEVYTDVFAEDQEDESKGGNEKLAAASAAASAVDSDFVSDSLSGSAIKRVNSDPDPDVIPSKVKNKN
ncbi:hypothetical protein PACTADRAFT_185969 [Pachysolen tannophilus NRRL Y-2460]|uniref:Histone chaperone domain-containing protein n=1 Tax=Pachysolen tannophilus NRRL Y-2460 TaxID=669874 RepID=A0A1E4U196_PACTA|nr:hypothetical protein PACTADRAFT_185969 [Pachysolen tannophilus NRRL Y-2460]